MFFRNPGHEIHNVVRLNAKNYPPKIEVIYVYIIVCIYIYIYIQMYSNYILMSNRHMREPWDIDYRTTSL